MGERGVASLLLTAGVVFELGGYPHTLCLFPNGLLKPPKEELPGGGGGGGVNVWWGALVLGFGVGDSPNELLKEDTLARAVAAGSVNSVGTGGELDDAMGGRIGVCC